MKSPIQSWIVKMRKDLRNYLSQHLIFGEGNGNPLQYSCLENPMDGGAWWAIVYGVTKNWTQLSMHVHTHTHKEGCCLGFS